MLSMLHGGAGTWQVCKQVKPGWNVAALRHDIHIHQPSTGDHIWQCYDTHGNSHAQATKGQSWGIASMKRTCLGHYVIELGKEACTGCQIAVQEWGRYVNRHSEQLRDSAGTMHV